MASPVPPFAILCAKYVAVVAVALLTAVANLLAMFTTLWIGGLLPLISGGDAFPFAAVGWIFLLLILFASFFSAVLLSLTSFARSFKEAQAYLIPVMLLSITPGMLSLLPGIRLSGALAVAPLINIVLLARETLSGTATATPATIAIVSTLAYAAAALGLASKLFGSDAVDRSGGGTFASMFRRPTVVSNAPTPPAAALTLALLVPIYFVVSGVLLSYLSGIKEILRAGANDLSIEQAATLQVRSMVLSAIALIVVFGGVPLLVSWLQKCRLKTTYRLNRFSPLSIIGCLTIAMAAWILAHEAFVIYTLVFGGLDAERIEQTRKVVEAWTMVPPWIMLLTLALTPAIIEELCFRGFLYSSFQKSLSPAKIILLTSLLFGLFHVITGSALLLERFVPSTMLGLMLGWVAYRTGSVIPGMALHFAHNGLLNLVGHYHKQLDLFDDRFDDQSHLPMVWIIGGAVVVIVGMAIVWWSTRNSRDQPLRQ